METKRVIAIESLKEGVLRTYGEGEYLGDLVPDDGFFGEMGIKNPCIKLDSGKYVWGYQCWWGDVEKFRRRYKEDITTEVVVEVEDEILPKQISNGEKETS